MTGRDLLSAVPPASGCASGTFLAGAALAWACYTPAEGPSVLWQAVDATGRLHAARWEMDGTVTYLTSADGGRTVRSSPVPLPAGFGAPRADAVDLKANAGAGVVAIAVHAQNAVTGQSQDLVAEYGYGTDGPVFRALHRVGRGDLTSGAGVSSTAPRFDFATVAVLPDGPDRDLLQRRRPHEPRGRRPRDPDAQPAPRGTAPVPDAPVPNGPCGPGRPRPDTREGGPADPPSAAATPPRRRPPRGRASARATACRGRPGSSAPTPRRRRSARARRDRSPRGPTSPAG